MLEKKNLNSDTVVYSHKIDYYFYVRNLVKQRNKAKQRVEESVADCLEWI